MSAGSTAGIEPASGPGTAAQHALDALRRAIMSGDLRPGERIRQDDVAERLGISIAPLREGLAVLEGEGQVTYRPRRGYSVTELRLGDVTEIYELRQLLEERAARAALPMLNDDDLDRIKLANAECVRAAEAGDVAAKLDGNRRFHFAVLDSPGQPHTMRMIRLLWDSTEAYRAMYYNSREERSRSLQSHDRIIEAVERRDSDLLVSELDAHRARGLEVLRGVLT